MRHHLQLKTWMFLFVTYLLMFHFSLTWADEKESIFLKSEISKHEVYANEEIYVRYYLYTLNPNLKFQIHTYPNFAEFRKRFYNPISASAQEMILKINGKNVRYWQFLIYEASIFAINNAHYVDSDEMGRLKVISKKIKLDPIRVLVKFFDKEDGLNNKTLTSPTEFVVVKNFDEEINALINHLVGNFTFEVKGPEKKEYLQEEVFKISLTVVGNGPLEFLSPPNIFPNEWDIVRVEKNLNFSGRKVSLKFDYFLKAREKRLFANTAINLAYFDTRDHKLKYFHHELSPVNIINNQELFDLAGKTVLKRNDFGDFVTEKDKDTELILKAAKPLWKTSPTWIKKHFGLTWRELLERGFLFFMTINFLLFLYLFYFLVQSSHAGRRNYFLQKKRKKVLSCINSFEKLIRRRKFTPVKTYIFSRHLLNALGDFVGSEPQLRVHYGNLLTDLQLPIEKQQYFIDLHQKIEYMEFHKTDITKANPAHWEYQEQHFKLLKDKVKAFSYDSAQKLK